MKKKVKFDWRFVLAMCAGIFFAGGILFVDAGYRSKIKALQADMAALEERKISANDIAYQIETWHRHNPYSVYYWRKIHHISMCQLIDLLLEHFEIKVVPEETTTKRKPLRLEKRKGGRP